MLWRNSITVETMKVMDEWEAAGWMKLICLIWSSGVDDSNEREIWEGEWGPVEREGG